MVLGERKKLVCCWNSPSWSPCQVCPSGLAKATRSLPRTDRPGTRRSGRCV